MNEFRFDKDGKVVAIFSIAKTDFACPKCGHIDNITKYGHRLYKSKYGAINIFCKGCKIKLGLTTDMKSDAVVYLAESEESIVREIKEEKVDFPAIFGDNWEEVKSIFESCENHS
jgi:transcription elongation factor Elf1